MTEYLDSLSAMNDGGDVVPRDDILEYDGTDTFGGEIFIPSLAFSSLVLERGHRRLQALAEHPSMAGESLEKMKETALGEVAQALLDTYNTEAEQLLRLGGNDRKPRIKLMTALTKCQVDHTVSAEEAHSIIAKITPKVSHQRRDQTVADSRPASSSEKPRYRDIRSAAAHDVDD